MTTEQRVRNDLRRLKRGVHTPSLPNARQRFCQAQSLSASKPGSGGTQVVGKANRQPSASIPANKPHKTALDVDLIRTENASLVVGVRGFQGDG